MAETERSSFLPYGIESLETNKTFLNIRNSKRLWLTNCGFDNTGRIFSAFYQFKIEGSWIPSKGDLRRSDSNLNRVFMYNVDTETQQIVPSIEGVKLKHLTDCSFH